MLSLPLTELPYYQDKRMLLSVRNQSCPIVPVGTHSLELCLKHNCVLFDACPPSLQDTVGSLPRLYYQTIVTLILATCEICGDMFYSIGLRF